MLVVGEVVRLAKPAGLREQFAWQDLSRRDFQAQVSVLGPAQSGACGVRDHAGACTSAQAEKWRPEEVLSWAFATYGRDVAIASGFGVEGMVLLDLASRVRARFSSLHPGHRIPVSRNLRSDGPGGKALWNQSREGLQHADSGGAGARTRAQRSGAAIPTGAAVCARSSRSRRS